MNTKLNHIKNWPELAQKAKWSVSNLAKLCEVSVRTLERHFLNKKGQKPKAWLAEQRWRKAFELLQEGVSVKVTASELHYQHASTFSREFKKRIGQSPIAFSNKTATQYVA